VYGSIVQRIFAVANSQKACCLLEGFGS
jgi:hypothetical protein